MFYIVALSVSEFQEKHPLVYMKIKRDCVHTMLSGDFFIFAGVDVNSAPLRATAQHNM